MLLLVVPGFIMRKAKLGSKNTARDFSFTVLYITQPALIVLSFIRPFDRQVLINAAAILFFSFIAHVLFILVSLLLFKRAPEDIQRVLQFGTIFSNAGFMGLPLIVSILGDEAAIYVSVYLIWFNVFSWSVGCLIYTGDKKYISFKKAFLNPVVISIFVGLLVFLLPIDTYIPDIIIDTLSHMKNTVAPMSMIVIGIRLADIKWKGTFKDTYMAAAIFTRLLLLPTCVWLVMKLVALTGLYSDEMTMSVVLLCSATPVGASTTMFAEKFNNNARYASKLVSLSTAFSLLTMPLISLLVKI